MAIGNSLGGVSGLTATQQQDYEDQMRRQQAQASINPQIVEAISTLEQRLIDVEEFIKYAADVDPKFEKLYAGWKAKKRIGI